MSLSQVPWQILIIGSSLFTSLALTLNKRQAHRGSALQVQSNKYVGSLLVASFWWLVFSRTWPSFWWGYYLYGMVVAVQLVIYTKAQRISMSQTSLTRPLGELMGILLSTVVLSEWQLFTENKGIRLLMALLLMPVLFLSFYEKDKKTSVEWLKLILIYSSSLAIFKVVVKHLLGSASAEQILMFQYMGSLTAGVLGSLLKKQKPFIGKRFAMNGIMQGCLGGTGIFMLYTAVKYSTVSQTSLLRTPLLVILTTLIGLIGFKEMQKMTVKKWVGVGVALLMTFLVITANH